MDSVEHWTLRSLILLQFGCYHTSYFADSRGSVNLRKNAGFHLVASGDDLVAKGGPGK
jgi:hypothetical protein